MLEVKTDALEASFEALEREDEDVAALRGEVAALNEPTRIDIALPDGLVDTIANVRALVQRRSSQGDCRFEPQGYPAQILGSSAVILKPAGTVHDFSDLTTRWTNGIEVTVPTAAGERPTQFLGLLAEIVGGLSLELAPLRVKFVDNTVAAATSAPFIVVGALPPEGSDPHVRFDRGRVTVNDRAGHRLIDLGGFNSGAVAQLVNAGNQPGIWVRPLTASSVVPGAERFNATRQSTLPRFNWAVSASRTADSIERSSSGKRTWRSR